LVLNSAVDLGVALSLFYVSLSVIVIGVGMCIRWVLGTIGIGKIADLIVVKENPMEDIQHLRQLLMVIKNGDIVSDKR